MSWARLEVSYLLGGAEPLRCPAPPEARPRLSVFVMARLPAPEPSIGARQRTPRSSTRGARMRKSVAVYESDAAVVAVILARYWAPIGVTETAVSPETEYLHEARTLLAHLADLPSATELAHRLGEMRAELGLPDGASDVRAAEAIFSWAALGIPGSEPQHAEAIESRRQATPRDSPVRRTPAKCPTQSLPTSG